ncbi:MULTISPECIES: amidase [Rhodomicrobium]|uniref:amidase n=1 Tax=Rhodomicrobium TaxID=1068 RepID=UPI000B4C0623|nr:MULTISPECIES: amidase [Rhodomicrobium]
MSVPELAQLTAVQMAAEIHAGNCRSEELVAACLSVIAEREETVGAWTHLDAEQALAQARNADLERSSGRPVGPLHGVPFAAKDIFDTADMPTEYGSPLFSGRQPLRDAAAIARLREAGAVLIGKTVTTEFAVYHPGKTRNPHNPERTPGGSSSGSAAAVAAHMVPFALGTQTNGSVIRPASFCGVYGLKPTFGLISRTGVLTQSPPLDTPGIFARSIEDLAVAADMLSAYDPEDAGMYPRSRGSHYRTAIAEPPLPPVLGFVKSPVWDRAEAGTKAAFEELADALGAHCEEVALPDGFASAIEWHGHIMLADLARHFGPLAERSGDAMSERLRGMIDQGRHVTAVQYNNARDQAARLAERFEDLFNRYGAILTPATSGPAPLGLGATGDPIFCTLWTYLGVPALSLPLLEVDAMPVGVQLIGARREDARLLRTARWLVNHLAAS